MHWAAGMTTDSRLANAGVGRLSIPSPWRIPSSTWWMRSCWVRMVSTNYRTRGYSRLQGIRTRPLAWLCAANWPTVLPCVIEKFRDNAMSEPLVRRSDDGSITILTLDRPDRRNALSRALMRELEDQLNRAGHDPKVRAVVLRSEEHTSELQ